MAKKDKPRVPTDGAGPKLTHSPFAGLSGVSGVASAAAGEPVAPAQAADAARAVAAPVKKRGRVVLRKETKHRGGKAVIVIAGFGALREIDDRALEALAKELKQALGCGGTVERRGSDREIVLQGDRAEAVAQLLRDRNFRVDGVGA
jgi:translation initiation factor 1 (eIF-1/SUI1)